MILQTEEQIKAAYVDGLLTDLEFDALIEKAVRGEDVVFWTGSRQPDLIFGPDV